MSILKLREETKAALAKLTPESRERVKNAARQLVETKTRKILQAENRLKLALDALELDDQTVDAKSGQHRAR